MKVIEPSYEIITPIDRSYIMKHLEAIGRTCYKSEDKITDESASPFIRGIIKSGHEAMIEHFSFSVRFIVNRAFTHEIVRHRIASFAQESQRYVSSINQKEFIIESENDIIDEYENGLTMKRISEISNGKWTEWDINKILIKNDVDKRNHNNSGPVNDTFFNIIDTPEKAYLMGLIQADGNIKNNTLSITQHENNHWYINRMIKNFISPTSRVYNDRMCKRMSVYSEKLTQSLINKGIVPNKTYDQTEQHIDILWNSIPDKYKATFIHGFLDGDGTLRFYKQNNPGETDSCRIEWVGNKHLLKKIKIWLKDTYQYDCNIRNDPVSDIVYRLSITQPQIGEMLCRDMMEFFQYPYAHPVKTARIIERIGGKYPIASWGDQKFQMIVPTYFHNNPSVNNWHWFEAMDNAEQTYREMRYNGARPQDARDVLPNSTKTEIVVTCNLREWRTIFSLRADKPAAPVMREIMVPFLKEMKEKLPDIFFDLEFEL